MLFLLISILPSLTVGVSSLTCFNCAVFSWDQMNELQKSDTNKLLNYLKAARCDDTTATLTKTCFSSQDECQKVKVTSYMKGDILQHGTLYQCGTTSERNDLCETYKTLAEYTSTAPSIEDCSVKACSSDRCMNPNGASFPSFNLAVLLSLFLILVIL